MVCGFVICITLLTTYQKFSKHVTIPLNHNKATPFINLCAIRRTLTCEDWFAWFCPLIIKCKDLSKIKTERLVNVYTGLFYTKDSPPKVKKWLSYELRNLEGVIQSYPMLSPKMLGGGSNSNFSLSTGLFYQLVSSRLKTHHKKFQLNRSRNGWVIKNSKKL